MWIGWIEFDIMLGDVHTLKEKRAIVRPLVNEIRRTFSVASAETDSLDLHRRVGISACAIASDSNHVIAVLDSVEQFMSARPEIELLSARRRVLNSQDFE